VRSKQKEDDEVTKFEETYFLASSIAGYCYCVSRTLFEKEVSLKKIS
jgi:hypothetical protein